MACIYINPKTKNELLLSNILREYYKLDDSQESSDFLDSKVKMFFTDSFKKVFGDWINGDKESFGRRVNEFGEPNLYKDGENFYVFDKNNEKYFINNRRFEGLEQYGFVNELSRIREEGTSKIVSYIFNKYKNRDEDITDIENISFNLMSEIDNFFKQQVIDNPDLEGDMEVLSQFKEDFYLEVIDYLSNINISYNEDSDIDDETYQENLEDNGAVVGTSSIERNSKDNATSSVKLMMSLIPDNESEAEFFTGYKLLPFSKIWNDVQKLLSDIPKIISSIDSKVVDPYSIMVERLNAMAINKPYIQELVKTLEGSSFNLQTQFVEAFANNGKYIQDTLEVNTDNYTYTSINAAESASKKSKLLTEFGLNFRGLFTTFNTASKVRSFDVVSYAKFREKFLDLSRNEKDNKGLLIQLKTIRRSIKDKITLSDELVAERDNIIKDTIDAFTGILVDLGIPITANSLNYYLADNGKLREPTMDSIIKQIDEFVAGYTYINDFLTVPGTEEEVINEVNKKLFDKNGKYLNIFKGEKNKITSQKVIENIADAIGYFNTDLNEDMFFSGENQMWVYSQVSHLYDTVNILNNDPNEIRRRLTLPFTRNSQYLRAYEDSIIKDEVSKAVIKIHRTNSMMEKDRPFESKDNVNTAKTDAINRDIFEALQGKKPDANSVYPTAVAADKPTTLKLEIGNFIETRGYLNEKDEVQLTDEVIDIFLGYFEDELLTALEAKKFIADNTDAKGNVDISKMTQYKHVSADGYVFDILNTSGKSIFKSDERFEDRNYLRNNSIEIDKIMASNPDAGFRKIYMGGVFKNYTTPSLSPENLIKRLDVFKYIYKSDFTPIDINTLTPQQKSILRPIVNKLLSNQIKDNLQLAVDAKVFRKSFARQTFDKKIYDIYAEEYNLPVVGQVDSATLKSIATEIISDYTINSTVAQIEFSKIFNGAVNNHKNVVDYFKRVPKTYIDGKGLRLGITENDHNFNVTVLQDAIVDSPYLEQMGEVGKKFYTDINQADAQSYITPERWKFLLERLGQFGKNEKAVYDKVQRMESGENVNFTSDELKTLSTKPLKGVYYSNIDNEPVYLKYSQSVLLKSLVKGSPLEGLLNKMRSQDISEAIFNSGVKVGAKLNEENTTLDVINNNSFKLNSIKLDNRFWKLQQDLPNKGFKETLLGSQIQKNIFDNFNFDGTYKYDNKDYSGIDVYSNIHETIGELSNRGIAKIVKKFQIDSDYIIRNWSQFSKEIADQLRKEKVTENIIKAVQKELTPYVIPQAKDKILSTIMSIINKSAVKLKTNGASLIQMSNFGLDQNLASNTGILWLKGKEQLAEPRKVLQEDGTPLVIPGQCFISGNILGQYIPNWRDYSTDQLFGEDRKGGIFPKEVLQMIGYRIPNQAMSSNDALEIVGILPDTYIDTIIPYTGITTKTGSDFDIDKMFIILPSLRTRYTNNRQLLRDYYKGVEIVDTINSLEDLLDDFGVLDSLSDEDKIKMLLSDDNTEKDIMGFYRNTIIFNIFNDKKLSKEFRRINKDKIKVEKVEYVPYDETKSVKEQDTEALNNRLFEMYHSILTQPDNYDNLITPIDHPHVKDFITKDLFPIASRMTDYKAFSALYQIDMKYEFIAGKFGIGQVANQLVDSIMNQVAQERLDSYLGWGNYIEMKYFDKEGNEKTRKVTVFDKKTENGAYDETNTYKISDTLTALLNGFVDIAKDPYITRGNWNTQTTPVGAMLVRAGIHPHKVLAFLAQPALVKMVNTISEREGILTKEGSSSTVIPELKEEYLGLLKKALVANGTLKNAKDSYWGILMNDVDKGKRTELNVSPEGFTDNKIQSRTVGHLKKNIEMNRLEEEKNAQYYLDQYLALKEYERIKPIVKEFNKSVSASKYGESGAGKSLIDNIIQSNKIADVFYKQMILNFEKKFYNPETVSGGMTSLGMYHKNTEMFLNNLVNANPKIFITGNDYFKSIMNEMVSSIHKNKKYLDDNEIGKIFEQAFYTMITSESSLFKMSGESVERSGREVPKEFFYLFTKPNEITPVTISDLVESTRQELRERGTNNFFLENIETKEDNNFVFIGIDSLRLKPNDFTEKLIEGWRDLEREYPSLAEDLVKYAYQQSGFRYNANQMYQFIPHEFFVRNSFNNYVTKVSEEINEGRIDPTIIQNNIYRHNWNNSKIVPVVNMRNMTKRSDGSPEIYNNGSGFKLDANSNRHSGKGYFGDTPMNTFPEFLNYDTHLYQLSGYAKRAGKDIFDPVYFKTHKLGYKSDKGQLHEYTMYKELSESNVRENNLNDAEKAFINNFKQKVNMIPVEAVIIDNLYITSIKSFNRNALISDIEVVALSVEEDIKNPVIVDDNGRVVRSYPSQINGISSKFLKDFIEFDESGKIIPLKDEDGVEDLSAYLQKIEDKYGKTAMTYADEIFEINNTTEEELKFISDNSEDAQKIYDLYIGGEEFLHIDDLIKDMLESNLIITDKNQTTISFESEDLWKANKDKILEKYPDFTLDMFSTMSIQEQKNLIECL